MLTSIDKFTYDPKTKRLTTNGPEIGIPSGDAIPGEITIIGEKKSVMFTYCYYDPNLAVYMFVPHLSWKSDPAVQDITVHIRNY